MNNFFKIMALGLFVVLINSCTIINPKEQTPYFLHIDSVQVANTNYYQNGSNSSKISDVWVYADNFLIGTYELPADIPIVTYGKALSVLPGIKVNGIANTRSIYPMYDVVVLPIDWKEGTRKTMQLTTKYISTLQLLVNEDFENGNSFSPVATGDTAVINYNKEVFEGNKSGALFLNNAYNKADNILLTDLFLKNGKIYYLEMNYKCDIPFKVKFSVIKNGIAEIKEFSGVNSKANWNKIYFDITPIVETNTNNAKYNLILSATLPTGVNSGKILLDNIKIISK